MAALAGIVGTLCTINLNSMELNILGNFVQAVGQIICVAQAQASNQQTSNSISNDDFLKFKNEIEYKLNYLYQITKVKIK